MRIVLVQGPDILPRTGDTLVGEGGIEISVADDHVAAGDFLLDPCHMLVAVGSIEHRQRPRLD